MNSGVSGSVRRGDVAIATIWKRYLLTNYGTFFQHYALRRQLREFGYESFRIIDANEHFGVLAILRTVIRGIVDLPRMCCSERVGFLRNLFSIFSIAALKIRFLREYRRLIGAEHEVQNLADAKAFIVGSDQVWTGMHRIPWGLDIPQEVPRVAYAVSADWSHCGVNADWLSWAGSHLKTFSRVSIREDKGVGICKNLLHDDRIVRTVDPVFFLQKDSYSQLTDSKVLFAKPTVLCYLVNLRALGDANLSLLRDVASRLGCELKIIAVQGAERFVPARWRIPAAPVDFIRCFRDASYVITNSFHGLAFSLIFEKQFVGLTQRDLPGADQNLRQRELLQRYEMAERLMSPSVTCDELVEALRQPIDQTSVRRITESQVSFSRQWLKDSLREVVK